MAAAAALWLAAALLYQAAAWLALARLLRRRRPAGATGLPSCTVLVPLKDLGPVSLASLRSLCALGVPVVAGLEAEPGRALADLRAALGTLPDLLTLRAGAAPSGANRKVANLERMLPAAGGEIAVLVDGDVVAPPGYLAEVLGPFRDPRVGLVTCPYRTVTGTALHQRIDALLTNAGFTPSAALAERLGVRFGLGATIAVRRRVLDETGGLGPLRDQLADDTVLARRVDRAGHAVVLAPLLVDHLVGRESPRAIWRRHLRWARTNRMLQPLGHLGSGVVHGVVPAMALAVGGGAAGLAGLAAWAIVRVGGCAALRGPLGLRARDLLLLPLADLFAFALYLGAFASRGVHWDERRLEVSGGAIAAPPNGERASERDRA